MEPKLENGPMILSAHLENPQSPARACDDDIEQEEDNQSAAVLAQFIATADGFEKKEHSWFAMSQVPTDLCVQVQDVTFHVHKFPLVSKCGYFNRNELNNLSSNSELKFDNFPGGPETFETILKFCYSLPISLNIENIAALRCGAELLEMSEAIEEDNLITKSEAFFTFLVLSSWKDSIAVLKSCESLSPWAENLQIVRRCCDSIAWKIARGSSTLGGILNGENWWFNDTTTLRINHFTRIVSALRAKGMSPEIIGSCIVRYADKWLPSIELDATGSRSCNKNELQWSITSGKRQEIDTETTTDQRMIVESLVSILPPQREAVSCKFLLKMLKLAIFYSISPALVSELEKRAALVLESADVSDLLIPSYANEGKLLANSVEENTMHNVDVVQRMLEYFLLYEHNHQQQLKQPASSAISKLLDSYLAEIARDPKLPVTKFLFLAQFLPENARTCDDGLYRAIDTYLKTHPSLSDHERRRLCKIMNCNKLSQDACAHAAQNDRLPLRTIIQILFSEQTKMRDAIKGNNQSQTPGNSDDQESNNQSTTNNEVKGLKIELERVKTLLAELQKGHYEVRQEYRNRKNNNNNNNKERRSSGWSIGWRKIRKSALFQVKTDLEETEEIQSRGGRSQKGSFRRRQSIS